LPHLRGIAIDNQEGYMLAKVLSGALLGIDAYPVEVEAHMPAGR